MPTTEINGAQIFYQTYGEDRPGQPPILLVHGSEMTGQEEWGYIAPLLGRRWRVIVPDCRGHGQSTNPKLTYNFKEMAGDMAALVRALGYSKTHLIGHSNGGNVALVTLVEYPEVVQTCILQAANAYVTPDLLRREPVYFDADRIAREEQGRLNTLIRLHGATHGAPYWRDLLRLTMQESVSAPNYGPEDLRKVDRPVMVIQGEKDVTNAPGKHGQFIARHIPYAEAWHPSGVGHNVHAEILFEWTKRVEDFLARRGQPVSEAIYRLKRDRFADAREGMFDVQVKQMEQAGKPQVRLSGRVLTEAQRQAATERATQAAGTSAQVDVTGLNVMLRKETPWALVNRNVTNLRREPRSLAERVSQALLGEIVRILDQSGEWSLVRLEHDGYIGWVQTKALHVCTFREVQAYQSACLWRVIAELLPARRDIHTGSLLSGTDNLAGKLPFGALVAVEGERGELYGLRLPDRRQWWVQKSGLLPLAHCPCPTPDGIAQTLDLVKRFIGVPYLWGGRTPFGYDCSGLAGTFYAFMGVNIPRDADQQFRAGIPVSGSALPGDLFYFGETDEETLRYSSVSHVAISLGNDELIHANGAAGGVSFNSIDPESPNYRAWLREHLVGIRRFL